MCVLPHAIYSHVGRLAGSSDIMLKVDTLRMIKATGVNWPSGFRGDFLNKFMPYEAITDIQMMAIATLWLLIGNQYYF